MARCTAPVRGHRTASGRANCPACGGRSYYNRPSYYPARATQYRGGGGGSSSGGSSSRSGGGSVSYTAAERRTLEPVARQAEKQAVAHPERRDLFLCHAWDDRNGAAKELHGLLKALDATAWFSEEDVGLGKSLLREIDRGLKNSRIGIVLVTAALLKSLEAEGIADKELSALLATDRVIPVAHGTTFEALRDVSPLLAARSGLSTEGSSLAEVAAKVADTVRVKDHT
jgi:hypothetical protein